MMITDGVNKKRIIVGVTGASGACYALRLIEVLLQGGHEVTLIASAMGARIVMHETGEELVALVEKGASAGPGRLVWQDNDDLFAGPASGSYRHDGMVIVPCSMKTLAAVASGSAGTLLERAADVTLKERRGLVLVPRETPLSRIHLRNLLAVSEAGAVVLPAAPGFYHRPESLADLVDFVVARVLDQLSIDHDLIARWGEG